MEAARNGYEFYKTIQSNDGHWAGEYGGPLFLIPGSFFSSSPSSLSRLTSLLFVFPSGLIIALYVTKSKPLSEPQRLEMIRYLCNRANVEEGGWGMCVWNSHPLSNVSNFRLFLSNSLSHTHSKPTVFGTALNYVSLRILGLGPEHPVCAKARENLHKMGGAGVVPSWGKAWCESILLCY